MLNNFGILNSNSLISLAFIHDCSDYMFRIYCQPFCFIFMSSVGSSAISILLYVERSFIPSFRVRLVFFMLQMANSFFNALFVTGDQQSSSMCSVDQTCESR